MEGDGWRSYDDDPVDVTCIGCQSPAVGFLRVNDYVNPDCRIFVCTSCAEFAAAVLCDVAYIDYLDEQEQRRRMGL